MRVALRRLDDLPARGWYSGDLHVHMNYGGAYRNDPPRLAFQARAEDLHVVENLIVNKERRIPDIGYFRGRSIRSRLRRRLIKHDQEFHTSYWGHLGLLGPARASRPAGLRRPTPTPPRRASYPTNADVADLAHAQGGLAGYVHPFDADPDPADTAQPLTAELPVDVALGKVDYYEALGFVDDPMATAQVWYRLLNCGFRLPAGAGHRRHGELRLAARPGGHESGLRAQRDRWTTGAFSTRSRRAGPSPPTGRCSSSASVGVGWARSCRLRRARATSPPACR